MTAIDILKRLCDAFFLTLDPFDATNKWPIEFMQLLETTLYDGEFDPEEYDATVLRALDLFKPYIEMLKEEMDK